MVCSTVIIDGYIQLKTAGVAIKN